MALSRFYLLFSLGIIASGASLPDRIAEIAAASHGKVGVSCLLDGKEICSLRIRDRFPMQSVYKLPIAMAVLDEVDDHRLSLDQPVRFLPSDRISPGQSSALRDAHPDANVDVSLKELLRLTISKGDGVASDILLRLTGGPAAANAYLRKLRLEGVAIVDTEKTIGTDWQAQYRNYAEPFAMTKLLALLSTNSPLSIESTKLLLEWMTETTTGVHRLRGLLPPNVTVAHRTGTSGTQNGITAATNDIGIITLPNGKHLYFAVFVSDSPENETICESVIARIAREAYLESIRT